MIEFLIILNIFWLIAVFITLIITYIQRKTDIENLYIEIKLIQDVILNLRNIVRKKLK